MEIYREICFEYFPTKKLAREAKTGVETTSGIVNLSLFKS